MFMNVIYMFDYCGTTIEFYCEYGTYGNILGKHTRTKSKLRIRLKIKTRTQTSSLRILKIKNFEISTTPSDSPSKMSRESKNKTSPDRQVLEKNRFCDLKTLTQNDVNTVIVT